MAKEKDPLDVYRRRFSAHLRRTRGALRSSKHELRAGDVDDLYFDLDMMSVDPGDCRRVFECFEALIRNVIGEEDIDFLAFMDKRREGTVGAIQYAVSLSLKFGLAHYIVRLEKRAHSQRIKIPGHEQPLPPNPLKEEKGVLVTGHSTTGQEIVEAIDTLEEFGAELHGVAMLTAWRDKLAEVSDRLAAKGITVTYLDALEDERSKGFKEHDVLVSRV